MAKARDIEFVKTASQLGFITHKQIEEALYTQRQLENNGESIALATLFVRSNLLKASDIAIITKHIASSSNHLENNLNKNIPTKIKTNQKASDKKKFGKYEIYELLGEGGMGKVYKAFDSELQREVAIKFLLSEIHGTQLERFRREAKLVAKLSHENIVKVYEIGNIENKNYISFEYIYGITLEEYIKKDNSFIEIAKLASKIAEAIYHANKNKVIHRDIKPANILLSKDNIPKVMDFGLAKDNAVDSSISHTGMVMGTPSYMPPEQARGEISKIGAATDVYSIGAVLYEMCTATPPFQGNSCAEIIAQVLENEPVSPRVISPGIPKDLEAIILKCMRKEPAKRYQSANILKKELELFIKGKPIKTRPPGLIYKGKKWIQRNPKSTISFFIIILLISIIINSHIKQVREVNLPT